MYRKSVSSITSDLQKVSEGEEILKITQTPSKIVVKKLTDRLAVPLCGES